MEEHEKFLVKDFMTEDVLSIDEEMSVDDAMNLVIDKKYNALPVTKNGKLIGIVSRMDLIKMFSVGLSPVYVDIWKTSSKKVKHIMRKAVVTVTPDDTIKAAADLIVEYRIRSLPVVDKEKNLVGIITVGDVLRAFMEMKRSNMG
ncbi:hypothetical protein Asulf_00262 [Archaeoglobus sulfaticallidus PM70-1]|uniref:CBS domain-containing protein n=1 Tax=Archaeoglobus sulfaticallidus PM70-1 TaxID=387631 RepID=N0BJG5_9EURY|nr:CBS domain-containing protein [Archaeoglobus sulfaticallidus]AGK60295.1 hypothetical protein Asulf_00262 [Archaeoglobus sulfaticallidus PM70-1]